MTSPTIDPHNPQHPSYQLGREASDWLVCQLEPETDPTHPYFDTQKRDQAFLEWLTRSPQHVKMYLETYETYQRTANIDPKKRIDVGRLLYKHDAEVIQLFGPAPPAARPHRRRRVVMGIAAGVAALTLVGVMSSKVFGPRECATTIGEQRTCKLEDGSVIYLNTDSRVKMQLTQHERHIELVRGEALFEVQHDAHRPFIVSTSRANIRAVGTRFNVRRRSESTDVTVVEVTVEVSDAGTDAITDGDQSSKSPGEGGSSALRVAAGEEASVARGHLNKQPHANVAEALSWRERRLMFRNTRLADVAAEFNRYNPRQIRIEGTIPMELTGTFDSDRPTALILYALRQTSLQVESDGDNWIIRPKE
jgi:transmembrane sensor